MVQYSGRNSNNNQSRRTRRYRTTAQIFSFGITILLISFAVGWLVSFYYAGNIPVIAGAVTLIYALLITGYADISHWYEIPFWMIGIAIMIALSPVAIVVGPIGYLLYLLGRQLYKIVLMIIAANAELGLYIIAGIVIITLKLTSVIFIAIFPGVQSLPSIPQEDALNAKFADVLKLNQIQITPNHSIENQVIVHPYVFNQRLFFHVVDSQFVGEIEIPQKTYTWFPERLLINLGINVNIDYTQRMAWYGDSIKDVVANHELLLNKEPVFVADGGMPNVNYQRIFQPRLVFRSYSLNKDLIAQNLHSLYQSPPISPNNTVIINGIPGTSEEFGKIKDIPGTWNEWQGIRDSWQNIISTRNYDKNSGHTAKEDALEALKHKSNVLVIVAHSNGQTIYFSDGSELTIDNLKEIQQEIAKNKPLVAFFSCETAQINGNLSSFGQTLIELGARAVIAPSGQIGARSSSILLDSILEKSAEMNISPIEAISQASQEANYLELENWVGFGINTDSNKVGGWL
jgi:hypothetical protein